MAQLTIKQRLELVSSEVQIRPHLGGSIIGHPCVRYLVYYFRWAYVDKIPLKTSRIFSLGDATEEIIIDTLKHIGIYVTDQQKQVGGYKGHAGGSIDGIIKSNILFEAKSMNQSNFLEVEKKGVLISKPQHYSQMQMYMGKLILPSALYVAMNKNTCDLYIEEVKFDNDRYNEMLNREYDIIEAKYINSFSKISSNPSWFHCKFCPAKAQCHNGKPVEKNCRTCKAARIEGGGEWFCMKHQKTLSVDEQRAGCGHWHLSEVFNV